MIRTLTPVISVTSLGCSIAFLVYYLWKEQVVSVIYHHSLLSVGKEVEVGITTGANVYRIYTFRICRYNHKRVHGLTGPLVTPS